MPYFIMSHALRIFQTDANKTNHKFGGSPIHHVVNPSLKKFKFHCLYLFDQTDSRMPNLLPDRKYLPLYYPIYNNACDFAYEVLSDEEIHVHKISEKTPLKSFPYKDFPEVLPKRTVDIDALSYEEHKTLVYFHSVEEKPRFLSDQDKTFLREKKYPFTQVGGIQFMPQDVPDQTCPNRNCENRELGIISDVFAVVWNTPIKDFSIWGQNMDTSQIIFQICRRCRTIHVCNRC